MKDRVTLHAGMCGDEVELELKTFSTHRGGQGCREWGKDKGKIHYGAVAVTTSITWS